MSDDKTYEQNVDRFYRGVVWGQLEQRLERMEKNAALAHATLANKIDDLEGKIDTINGRMKYIYGFAAGIGFILSFLWDWIKIKLHL